MSFALCHQVVLSGDLDWDWIHRQQLCFQHCFPPLSQHSSWQVSPSFRHVSVAPSSSSSPTSSWTSADFIVVTANVLALDTDPEGLLPEADSSRAERLSEQWQEARFAVVGVQESRRSAGRYETSHYIILSSGSQITNHIPHFGCELWLHKSLPVLVSESGSYTLAQFRIAVAHADPRRLIVHLQLDHIAFSFAVLHAPCRSSTTDLQAVEEWWDETSALFSRIALAEMTWICIDANAPLASAESHFYGLHGCDPMNEQGSRFEQFLTGHRLYAPLQCRGAIKVITILGRIHVATVFDVIMCFAVRQLFSGVNHHGRNPLMILALLMKTTYLRVSLLVAGGMAPCVRRGSLGTAAP